MSGDEDDPARRKRISRAGAEYAEYMTAVGTDVLPGDPEHAADAAHRMRVTLGVMPPDEPDVNEERHG